MTFINWLNDFSLDRAFGVKDNELYEKNRFFGWLFMVTWGMMEFGGLWELRFRVGGLVDRIVCVFVGHIVDDNWDAIICGDYYCSCDRCGTRIKIGSSAENKNGKSGG